MAHRRAKLTPYGRSVLVDRVLIEGWSVGEVAKAASVSPDNVHKTGVWPIGPRAFPVVAVEAGQVERTRRKDLVTGSTRVFVPYTLMPGRATASSGSVGQASVSRGNAPYMVAVTALHDRVQIDRIAPSALPS